MCKLRYCNSVHLKVLVSNFNLRGHRPLSDFVQELEKKMLRFRLLSHLRFDGYTWDMTQGG